MLIVKKVLYIPKSFKEFGFCQFEKHQYIEKESMVLVQFLDDA